MSANYGLVGAAWNTADHVRHGNYGTAVYEGIKGHAIGAVADFVTCGGASAIDKIQIARDVAHDATRTEYQGRGRPRDSDRNHNGYHDFKDPPTNVENPPVTMSWRLSQLVEGTTE